MKSNNEKLRNEKLKWLFRGSLFLLITFIVLIIISFNSDFLINSSLRIVFIILSLFCIGGIIYSYKKFTFKKLYIILFIIYTVCCSVFIFILYGPNKSFKDWLITTAMGTQTHQYYCKWFYNENDINNTLAKHYIIEPDEDTNSSLVNKNEEDNNDEVVYKNEYEKIILDRDKDAAYKIHEFDYKGSDAYLGIVYNPEDVHVGVTKYLFDRGEYVINMTKRYNSELAINAGRFEDPNYSGSAGTPVGITYSNGILKTGGSTTQSKVIGFNEDNVLMLINDCTVEKAEKLKIRDSVYSAPFLIVNGKPSFIAGNGGWGVAARTAIGQRKDGIVLFLVIDSNEFRTAGADMVDLTEIMMNYGAINAANLDGGTSSVMAHHHKLINDPIDSTLTHKTRPVATMFYVE